MRRMPRRAIPDTTRRQTSSTNSVPLASFPLMTPRTDLPSSPLSSVTRTVSWLDNGHLQFKQIDATPCVLLSPALAKADHVVGNDGAAYALRVVEPRDITQAALDTGCVWFLLSDFVSSLTAPAQPTNGALADALARTQERLEKLQEGENQFRSVLLAIGDAVKRAIPSP